MSVADTARQAAYTKQALPYPGYVNVTREGDRFTISVRGDAREDREGALASLSLTRGEWEQFYAEISHRLFSA